MYEHSTRYSYIERVLLWTSVICCICYVSKPLTSIAEEQNEPKYAFGINVMQPAVYGLGSSFFEDSKYIPIPIEGHVRITSQWGLAGTLKYFYHQDGGYKANGLVVALGPRVTLLGEGIQGLYATLKIGVSFRNGEDYFGDHHYRVGIALCPEIGYAFTWGPPGFYLTAGVGMQTEAVLTESEHSSWEWNGLGKMINYYLPIANITLGFDI